jgi:hypothetical protein
MMRKFLLALACSVALVIGAPVAALAAATPTTTGQPGAPANTCPGTTGTPGGSATASGSPFNGSGQAGLVYAGNPGTPSLANGSGVAISQYDIACFRP